MCGIFGVLLHTEGPPPDPKRLRETGDLMKHRGPDHTGIHADSNIGLVATRLSLLDLEARSNQPFWDKARRRVLVYNGEIYNFRDLRRKLERSGVMFRTTSDTEVLLEALLAWGPEATLPKLEGMFAFALYDSHDRTLVLGRDRFGIKPLFVHDSAQAFVFGSEFMAMRPWLSPLAPDRLSIASFLFGAAEPTKGFTFLEHVKSVDPGAVVRIATSQRPSCSSVLSVGELWQPAEHDRLHARTSRQLVDELDELLDDSVRLQLTADAPVGVLCSGGVDSALTTALAARHHSQIAVFHANVVGRLSEYEAASTVARHLKLDLRAVEIHDRDFLRRIPDVIAHYGHPFASRIESVPVLMLSELVQRHRVKAVLTGEGADEEFLGYSYLLPDVRRWRRLRHVLHSLRQLAPGSRAASFRFWGPDFLGLHTATAPLEIATALHNRLETLEEALEVRARMNHANGAHKSALQSIDLLHYNLRSLLHRNDSMGMAASVESRFPYLDTRVVRFAVNAPYRAKIRYSPTALDQTHYFVRDKWVLRKVAERYLPRSIAQRTKKPFPVNAYYASRMRIAPAFFHDSVVKDLFSLSRNQIGYIAGLAPHALKWKLLLLDIWARIFLDGASAPSCAEILAEHVAIGDAIESGAFPAPSVVTPGGGNLP